MRFGRARNLHMVGIGGSGMSGIAEVLLNLRYTVSGSDMSEGEAVVHLRGLGGIIHIGHAAAHVEGADGGGTPAACYPSLIAINQFLFPVKTGPDRCAQRWGESCKPGIIIAVRGSCFPGSRPGESHLTDGSAGSHIYN